MQGDDLHRLTDTESRLAAQLAAAEAEACRRVQEARSDADRAERDLATELAAAEGALAREVEAEVERRRTSFAERAGVEAARLDGLSPADVAELAAGVVERLLAPLQNEGAP